jgi:hypothetical protein
MSRCDKILEKAKNSPNNLSFDELCYLAECNGFIWQRTSGSHNIYENSNLLPEQNRNLNFQNVNGKAKPYQVKQLLRAIEYLRHGK